MRAWPVALLLVATAITGCFGGDDLYPHYDPADGNYHYEMTVAGHLIHFDWAPGAMGKIWNKDPEAVEATLPSTFLLIPEPGTSGSFQLAEGPLALGADQKQFFLAPPAAKTVIFTVAGETVTLDPEADLGPVEHNQQIVSGENMVELAKHQEAEFPHRTPGMPNYYAAAEYFRDQFASLGYQVEMDPYGTHDLTVPEACFGEGLGNLCPESLLNIVATKPGTGPNAGKIIFVGGGHYDMVPQTTHAAWDDTGGTLMTLELARALAPFEFDHTLMFGLWGGEENGILGSQFWVRSNPDKIANVVSYWNLDGVGGSWPAPLPAPAQHLIAVGPDAPGGQSGEAAGPIAEDLQGWAQTLQTEWFGFPSEYFLYEGVASGQATGAGFNAQSDHTPFITAGVPSFFSIHADLLGVPVAIHSEQDTLDNMTKYAFYGSEVDLDSSWPTDEERRQGEQALAQSWEATMWFPFYHAVLTDLGVYTPPAAINQAGQASR